MSNASILTESGVADFTDNASVNTYGLPGGEELVAMTEVVTGTARVDVKTLDIIERVKYNDDISALMTTAHPVIYPDGSIYNLFSNVRSHLHVIQMHTLGAIKSVR